MRPIKTLLFFLGFILNNSFAGTYELNSTQEKIVESVIRYHFNLSGTPNELIARIGLPGTSDPTQSFLNKFNDYDGYFAKLSDISTANSESNLYWFMIYDITWISSDYVKVHAEDGHLVAIQRFRFNLQRQSNGSWQVTEAKVILPDPS